MTIIKAVPTPAEPAPLSETSVIGWMQKNLFSSVFNGLLTIAALYIIYIVVKGMGTWGVVDAVWVADNRRECFSINPDGACWAGIFAWVDNIFYGRYPREELWRINLGILSLFIWMVPLWLPRVKAKISIGLTTVFLYPFLAGYLFSGGDNRRSKLPVARVLSTSFIELFRSVPLITVLFMATTMFPLFMPEGFVLNKLVQVIIAVCLFNACYMAETVRGGLQTIPIGQFEGGHTIGLGYWQTMGLIIMPQALKRMIPNIVGNFISLLKDTTLVSIIGLFDVLTMLRAIGKDRTWLGLHLEPLVFGALLFFLLCFAMSKYSRHLEVKLSTDHNN